MKEGEKLYEIFEKLLQEHETTINRVAVETGIPRTVLYDWKSGRSTPKVDKLLKIAQYFGVSLEYLLEGGERDQ